MECLKMLNRNTDNQGEMIDLLKQLTNDGKTDPVNEMKAYDKLGPLTRRAIDEWPLPWSAELTLQSMRNPLSPSEDKYMANYIKDFGKKVIAALVYENETMPILAIR
jgi:hypothetical protein